MRLALVRRRAGAGDGVVVRLGAAGDRHRQLPGHRGRAGRSISPSRSSSSCGSSPSARPGVHRPALLREVWGYDFYGGTRTVDVHVRRLRAKLGPEHEHLIQTVRGVGYRRLTEPERRASALRASPLDTGT